jgi:enoyl-CoA hydratase/carnithine racemase
MARRLAALPLPSLVATKRLVRDAWIESARAARTREEDVFRTLLGQRDSQDALDAFLAR